MPGGEGGEGEQGHGRGVASGNTSVLTPFPAGVLQTCGVRMYHCQPLAGVPGSANLSPPCGAKLRAREQARRRQNCGPRDECKPSKETDG